MSVDLARAVGAEQAVGLARRDLERDVFERVRHRAARAHQTLALAEGFTEAADFYPEIRHHFTHLPDLRVVGQPLSV
ncbi:MAG TPA: hypothetical protein VF611_00815 [Pyrinomonadaceae bacterium]